MFIAHCFKENLSASTVESYLSVIGYFHKLSNCNDMTQHFIIRKSLNGYQKMRNVKDSRLPITPAILNSLIHSLIHTCNSNFLRHMFKAMYLLAFHAFLRIGEITGSTPPQGKCLCANNITFKFDHANTLEGLELKFNQYKHRSGMHLPVLFVQRNLSNPIMCPVMALWEYWQLRKHIDLNAPLFSFMADSKLSRQFFACQLKLSLKWAGLSQQNYKSHSFRIGAATTAAMAGISEEKKIQQMGRWKSSAFKKYIRIPTLNL